MDREPLLIVEDDEDIQRIVRMSLERVGKMTVAVVSGVILSLRPLPWQATCGPGPRCTSRRVSPVSSEIRSPVWIVSASMAWSRRPVQVAWSQAASRASISGSVR